MMSSSAGGSPLLALPVDLFEGCLLFCRPQEVFNVALTCRRAYQQLSANEGFWRTFFLQDWDDPRLNPPAPPSDHPRALDVPWSQRVWQIDAALRAFESKEPTDQDVEIILDLLANSSSSHGACLRRSQNVRAMLDLLEDPAVIASACAPDRFGSGRVLRSRALPSEMSSLASSQVSAKLSAIWNCSSLFAPESRDSARSRVYDLSRYSEETAFGPFLPERDQDKRAQHTDWIQMDAIVRTIAPNVEELFDALEDGELDSILPRSPEHARPYTLAKPSNPLDWAGIEGQWRRVVCFLDYRDLFVFNIHRLQGHDPMVHTDEAVRLLSMDVSITKIGSPSDPEGTRYPTLYFHGRTSGGQTPHESTCRGNVSMMADGNAKWESISHYSGEDRWSTVAVQVGGVQSSRGFFGIWSGIEHAFEDPAGPTWLFKRSKYDDY